MKITNKILFRAILVFVMFFIFAGSAKATEDGKVIFLGNKNIPPVIYIDNGTAKGVGFDLAKAVGDRLSLPYEIRAMDWLTAQQLVATGTADVLVQINQTEERKKLYDFSDPLLESHFSIFTLSNRIGISDLNGLYGLRVGVEAGGLPQNILKADPFINLFIIPDFLEGFHLLMLGNIDAVVVDYRVGSYVIASNNLKDIKVTGEPIAPSYSAFAVKKGNVELLAKINQALRSMKEDGTYQRIVEAWQPKEVIFETKAEISKRYSYITSFIILLLFLLLGLWIFIIMKWFTEKMSPRRLDNGGIASEYAGSKDDGSKSKYILAILALTTILSWGLFIGVEIFRSKLYFIFTAANYLDLHNFIEFTGIVVSLSIFSFGYFTYKQSRDNYTLFLGILFLCVGLLDFLHTLSFPGMPGIVTPSSTDKGIQFWLSARLIAAVGFFVSAFVTSAGRGLELSKKGLLAIALTIPIFQFIWVTFYPEHLIVFFVPGKGLTATKIIFEYIIVGICGLSLLAYYYRYLKTRKRVLVWFMAAFIVSIFSELAFTLYKSAYDTYNLLGHIYKLVAYSLIFRGVFVVAAKEPFLRLSESQEQLFKSNRTLKMLSECNQALVHVSNDRELAQKVCDLIVTVGGYKMAWIGLAENDKAKTVTPLGFSGEGTKEYLADTKISWSAKDKGCPSGRAICRSEQVVVPDIRLDTCMGDLKERLVKNGIASAAAVPLFINNEVGALTVYSDELNAFGNTEMAVITELANDVAYGMATVKMTAAKKRAESDLLLSHEYLQDLISTANVIILGLDTSGKVTMFNETAEKITGYSFKDLKGRNWFEVVVPESRYPKVNEVLLDYLKTKGALPPTFENPILTKKGEERIISWQNNAVVSPSGAPAIICFGIDVTDRKRADQALFEERRLFMGGPNVAFKWRNAKGWPVEYVSPNVTKQFGYAPEDFTSGKILYANIVHEDDLVKVGEEVENYVKTGKDNFEQDYRILRSDGKYCWVHDFTSIIRDEKGKVLRFQGHIHDITERKNIEEKLIKTSKEISDLYNKAPAGYHSLNKNGEFIDINDTELAWLGYGRDEVIGKKFIDFTNEEGRKTFAKNFPFFKKNGYIKDLEFELVKKDGSIMNVLVSATAVNDENGNYLKSRSTMTDITERKKIEQALKESEEKYRDVVERADDGIAIIQDQIVKYGNNALEKMAGEPLANVIGRSFFEYLAPEAVETVRRNYEARLRGELIPRRYETVLLNKKNKRLFVEFDAGVINFDNRPADLVIIHDITERKISEDKLRESEERFRKIFDSSALGASLVDPTGRWLRVNEALCKITGYSEKELLSKAYLQITHPDDVEKTKNITSRLLSGEIDTGSFEKRYINKKKEVVWVSLNISTVKDPDGKLAYFVVHTVDITKRKKLEEENRIHAEKNREQLRELLEARKAMLAVMGELTISKANTEKEVAKDEAILASVAEGVVVTDEKGKIMILNQAASDMIGHRESEVAGQAFSVVTSLADDKERELSPSEWPVMQAIRTKKACSGNFIVTRNDKLKFPIFLSVAPVTQNKKILGAVGVFRDITKEREIDRAKSEFVSVASHQLRTPLTGIKWFTELSMKNDLDSKTRDYLNQIYASNERMIRLVDDLLNVSRIDTGNKFDITPTRTDVLKVVKNIAEECEKESKGKVSIDFLSSVPKKIVLPADELKIRQVFENLIGNAVKYSKGKATVTIGYEKGKGYGIFMIKDKGIGIPKKQQKRVFEKFFRADNAALVRADGTGLGLYIVKAVVEGHGGNIWFESKEGAGTTFWFTLPLRSSKGGKNE